MLLFRKREKESESIDITRLKNTGGDSYLDGRVPVDRLIIEEEISEPISLVEYIAKLKEQAEKE